MRRNIRRIIWAYLSAVLHVRSSLILWRRWLAGEREMKLPSISWRSYPTRCCDQFTSSNIKRNDAWHIIDLKLCDASTRWSAVRSSSRIISRYLRNDSILFGQRAPRWRHFDQSFSRVELPKQHMAVGSVVIIYSICVQLASVIREPRYHRKICLGGRPAYTVCILILMRRYFRLTKIRRPLASWWRGILRLSEPVVKLMTSNFSKI